MLTAILPDTSITRVSPTATARSSAIRSGFAPGAISRQGKSWPTTTTLTASRSSSADAGLDASDVYDCRQEYEDGAPFCGPPVMKRLLVFFFATFVIFVVQTSVPAQTEIGEPDLAAASAGRTLRIG